MNLLTRASLLALAKSRYYVLWGDKGELILQDAPGNDLTNLKVYSQTYVQRLPLGNGRYIQVWLYL